MPGSAVVDVEAYAAELDAVETAVDKSISAHDGITMLSPWGWGDPQVRDSVIVGVDKRPVAPILAVDADRAAVAILQR
jgi:hypothetical protein